jgi:small ligand-binding sensory domain FIST
VAWEPEWALKVRVKSVAMSMLGMPAMDGGGSAVEDMERMLASIQSGLTGTPRGGVYYSSLGRGESLFGPGSEELRMISRALGDIPLVGFFANGEISHNRLYGYTGVLTLFL